MLDAFNQLNSVQSFESAVEEYQPKIQTEWDRPMEDPHVWLDRYDKFVDRPRFNPNIDGYISPYASGHWGGTSDILQGIASRMELGPLEEKVDPNKIFTSDIAALKTLAADQIKIVKLFERKLMESLNDKGKFGLNEDDIEAMQALTSARSAITQINKEQIAVKKSIAELKIKQSQSAAASGQQGPGSGRTISTFEVGRSIMDNIFDAQQPMQQTQQPIVANYPAMDIDQAATVLDNIVDAGTIAATTIYESDEPTTYVVVGDSDSDTEYVTYSSSGEILADYPNPTSKITNVDRQTNRALDEFMVPYPVKYKNEL